MALGEGTKDEDIVMKVIQEGRKLYHSRHAEYEPSCVYLGYSTSRRSKSNERVSRILLNHPMPILPEVRETSRYQR